MDGRVSAIEFGDNLMKLKSRRSKILLAVVGCLMMMQLVPPPRSAPPINGVVEAPPEVRAILRDACWDCHSSETKWPVYSRVAPLSWWIGWHVSHGREYLNFTDWDGLSGKERGHAMHEIVEVVEEGEMPLASYTWLHPEARLNGEQKRVLVEWAQAMSGGEEGDD